MKIVFISFFRKDFGGGAGRVAHEIAQYFSRAHEVVLICPAEKTGLTSGEHGLRVFGIRSAARGDVAIPIITAGTVNKLFTFLNEFHPDIVHAHDPTPLGLLGQIWAKMRRVPFVQTAHMLPSKVLEFGATDAVGLMRSSVTQSVALRFLTTFYDNCDAVVALNHSAADDIQQFGYRKRIFIIPNGRDLARYATCPVADITSPEKMLTFIGFITKRKNQLYLLDMLRYLPETYRLQLVGEPLSKKDAARIQEFIAAHDLQQRVLLTGQVRHEAIPEYLSNTHVFVSASKMEVQSLVVIEALAAATPVVGLANETINELVDDAVGCCLPKDTDPAHFARCVQAICDLPSAEYTAMALRARERVQPLDWGNIMQMTITAYQALLEEQHLVKPAKRTELTRLVDLLPAGEIRAALNKQLEILERKIEQRVPLEPLADDLRSARSLGSKSWLFAALTLPVSLLAFLAVKAWATLGKRKKSAMQ